MVKEKNTLDWLHKALLTILIFFIVSGGIYLEDVSKKNKIFIHNALENVMFTLNKYEICMNDLKTSNNNLELCMMKWGETLTYCRKQVEN